MSTSNKSSVLSMDLPAPQPTGNIFTGWTVLGNSIVGTGMLGLAYAVAQCGWVLGLTMFSVFGLLSFFSLHLLNEIAMAMPGKRLSYFTAAAACAPKLKVFIDIVIVIHNIGVDTAYLQVFASMFSAVLEHWFPGIMDDGRRWFVRAGLIVGIALVLAPVCFFRTISGTAPSSVFGILSFLYVVITGVIYCLTQAEPIGTDALWPATDVWGVLSVLPVFIFGFSCHFNAFAVAEDLKQRTQTKLDIVSALAILSSCVLYVPAMTVPYAVYGDTVEDNFYMSMPLTDLSIHVGYVILPFAVLTAYPLLLLPCRVSMTNIFGLWYPKKRDSTAVHVSMTLAFLILTAALAIAFSSLGVTMSLIGIIGTNTITFIMPTYMYCSMFREGPKGVVAVGVSTRKLAFIWYCSAALFIVSCCLFPICLSGLIYTLV